MIARARMRCLVALLLALAVLALPASAGAVTFGADLNEPAGPTGTCGTPCFIFASSTTTGYYSPISGIVNTVRIRTADVPQGDGQVQIVVMRSYFQNNPNSPGKPNFFCCFVQEYGPTVTLQRNAVNTFNNLNVGMVEQPTPQPDDFNTVATGDFIALNLSGTVPGPLGQDGGGFVDINDPATEPAPGANPHGGFRQRLTGVNIRMNADLNDGGGRGGGGGGGGGGNAPAAPPTPPPPTVAVPVLPPANPTNPLTLGGGTLLGNTVAIPITCALDTTCAGLVQLINQAQAAKAKKSKKPADYGRARFSIPAHRTAKVRVRLNAAGKKLVKKRRSVRLVARTTVGGQVTTTPVTLKRAAPPKKRKTR